MNFVEWCSSISVVIFRSAAAAAATAVAAVAMAGLRSPGTRRKITVSANIYPGSRGGNVRLDSDSELISFEIPTPHLTPRTSSASATRFLPSMRRSPPPPYPPRYPSAFSSFTRFRPSSTSDASSFHPRPRSFTALLFCSRPCFVVSVSF